jgi:hypothetical protein
MCECDLNKNQFFFQPYIFFEKGLNLVGFEFVL